MSSANQPSLPVLPLQNTAEDKRKHLEFIQSVITRMNSNSFMIKGWSVTIVAALLALFASSKNIGFLYINTLPVVLFWVLDAKYLQFERKFRTLYNEAVKSQPSIPLFEMNINHPTLPKEEKNRYLKVLRADTIWPFYLFLLIVTGLCIFFIQILVEPDKKNNLLIEGTVGVMVIDSIKKNDTVINKVIFTDTLKSNQ